MREILTQRPLGLEMRAALGLWLLLRTSCGVVMPEEALGDDDGDRSYSLATSVRRCVEGGGGRELLPCLSEGAVAELARADTADVLQVAEGVYLAVDDDDKSSRTVLPLDQDPTNYRTMLDVLSTFMARRSLRWDLGKVYPGLLLKVGGGVLEFVLDRRQSGFQDRHLGTGGMLLRHLVLPAIVGAKIGVAVLVPLFFLLVAVVAKKALLLSKLAVLASGFLGLNSLFLFQQQQQQQQQHQLPSYLPPPPLYLDRRPHDEPRGRNIIWEDSPRSTRD